MTRHYFILSLLSLPLLSNCSILPATQNPQIIQAETYLLHGQNKEAAQIYQQLATTELAQQHQFRLLTADALIKANEMKQAKQFIDLIDLNQLSEAQRNHLNFLQAQIHLSTGRAEVALAELKNVQIQAFDAPTTITYYQSLAFAYSLVGDFLQSTQALLAINLILPTDKLTQHYETILKTLSSLSAQDLQIRQSVSTENLNSWMALAQVFKLQPNAVNDALAQWKKLYPAHPANAEFLTHYLAHYQQDVSQAKVVAVLLPKSGMFAEAANLIKVGFAKAYQIAEKSSQPRPEIRFYDSSKLGSPALYQQAVKEGAQLVVGPLDKNKISSLIHAGNLTVPVLALNHIEGLTNPKVYQFGLSPIDDAQACATKAHHDGKQTAIILVPDTEQGDRFKHYLSDSWKGLGGTVAEVLSYNEKNTHFAALINKLSQLSAKNPDVILLNAYAKPARTLANQLLSNFSTAGLPVYATSQIYTGDNNEIQDESLGGITFCDVPWMFSQAYSGELSKSNLQSSWQGVAPSYLRLLSLGIDAYNVMSHLNQLKTVPYQAATGKLTLDSQNKINRELYCAKFVNGVPKPIGFASENSSEEFLIPSKVLTTPQQAAPAGEND